MKTNYIREYFLASEDGGIAWDKTYKLVFTSEGQMFVQVVKQFEQIHKTPDIDEIQPVDFAKYLVNEIPLTDLVAKKLDEVRSQGSAI